MSDPRLRQRLLQFGAAGVGDPGSRDPERLEFGEVLATHWLPGNLVRNQFESCPVNSMRNQTARRTSRRRAVYSF